MRHKTKTANRTPRNDNDNLKPVYKLSADNGTTRQTTGQTEGSNRYNSDRHNHSNVQSDNDFNWRTRQSSCQNEGSQRKMTTCQTSGQNDGYYLQNSHVRNRSNSIKSKAMKIDPLKSVTKPFCHRLSQMSKIFTDYSITT